MCNKFTQEQISEILFDLANKSGIVFLVNKQWRWILTRSLGFELEIFAKFRFKVLSIFEKSV
jgi:hypothetical protein